MAKRKGPMISGVVKGEGKVLVPFPVSLDREARVEPHGTKAFVRSGTRLKRGLGPISEGLARREIAEISSHYIKRVNASQLKIRETLEANGIRCEKILEDLKDGTCLFEREGHAINSDEGRKILARNPLKIVEQIERIVVEMHSLGITHEHLHTGNIVLTEKGEVIIIDLEKAVFGQNPKTKKAVLERYSDDLCRVAHDLARDCFDAAPQLFPAHDVIGMRREIMDSILSQYVENGVVDRKILPTVQEVLEFRGIK